MKLAIFNGSPRKEKSNSTLLINHFLKGYNNSESLPIHYLGKANKIEEHLKAFSEADHIIVIFPLYTDAMPGQVKYFFESLAEINTSGKHLGFIVQSGFPESHHSIYVERYLKKLAQHLNCDYTGTVIKGGVEGIQIMPPSMTKKLYDRFYKLGKHFSITGNFNTEIVTKLRSPHKMSPIRLLVFKIMLSTGLANYYWDKKLKENNVFKQRFAQPYA